MLWLPKRTQLWVLSPTGCTEGCVYFPQSCRNTHLPHFLDCLLNTTLDPLLTCLLSLDTSRTSLRLQRSTKFSNRHTAHGQYHITWLTHVRTGPKKKKSRPDALWPLTALLRQFTALLRPLTDLLRPLSDLLRPLLVGVRQCSAAECTYGPPYTRSSPRG